MVENINAQRLLKNIDDFAKIGGTKNCGVNRQALSKEDQKARRLLTELAKARNFTVVQDAMANLFIRKKGQDNSLPPILIGSHLDSQITGGRFDGALGTLCAFEVMESLEDKKITTPYPLEVVAWTNEEGSRYAPGSMGAQAFVQKNIPPQWLFIKDSNGETLENALKDTINNLDDVPIEKLGHAITAYIELHIEQGPLLENANIPIGVVYGIQGTRWLEISIHGQSAHAGTCGLEFRHDPMVVFVDAVHVLNQNIMPKDQDARFTIGRVEILPSTINAIPYLVKFSVDLRHPKSETLDRFENNIIKTCQNIAKAHGCHIEVKKLFAMQPTTFSKKMVKSIKKAVTDIGLSHLDMLSGAFHDALFINAIAPTAMIFVPCRDGISHNEAEFVEPKHCVNGANALYAATLEAMAEF